MSYQLDTSSALRAAEDAIEEGKAITLIPLSEHRVLVLEANQSMKDAEVRFG